MTVENSMDITNNNLNSSDGHKRIKDLYFIHGKKSFDYNYNKKVIQKAMEIYNNINDDKTHIVINAFLKICLHFKHPEKGLIVLDDVEKILLSESMNNNQNNRNISYPSLIKCCIKSNNFEKGKQIHQMIEAKHNDIFTQTTFIHFYGHFNDINNAENIFNALSDDIKTSVTIGAMMKVLIDNGYYKKALSIYDQYIDLIDDVLHLLAVKACTNSNNFEKGKEIAMLIKGLNHDIELFNVLIDFYGHYGDIQSALNIFNSIPNEKKKIDTINSMMKVYVNNNLYQEALVLYDSFNSMIDDISRILALKACTNSGNWDKGKQIHSKLTWKIRNIQLINTLIDFYGSFGDIIVALKIFDAVNNRNKTSSTLNAMMKGLINNEESSKALAFYNKFYELNDHISHLLAIKACVNINNFKKGKYIIDNTMNYNENIINKTAMIDFYGHFGDIDKAESIFDSIAENNKDVISVGAMMQIYVYNGYNDKALELYQIFDSLNDNISHVLAIKACINGNNVEKGKQIHQKIIDSKQYQSIELKNTLIDLYGNYGDFRAALEIFNDIDDKNKQIATMNAMMDAYCISNMNKQCIELFENIEKLYDLTPSMISYAVVLKACTQSTMFHFGQQIHENLKKNEKCKWMLQDTSIQINLINFYGKCGILNVCNDIFNDIKQYEHDKYLKEIRIWNAMIKAYGRNADPIKAKEILNEMRNETELNADNQIFKALINAYSHCGNEMDAKLLWENEIEDELKYDIFIITALVDCYSRKGYISDAYKLIVKYCEYDNSNNIENKAMWISLLSGCKTFNNKEIAQIAYNEINKRFN